jgi:hypothetical protein
MLHAESATERDLFEPSEPPQIVWGTVGWDDAADWVEEGTASPDGVTLVRVQLIMGRTQGAPLSGNQAQGYRVRAQVAGPLWHIPAKGTRVLVAIAAGAMQTPGSAVILAELGASPARTFGTAATVLDMGTDRDMVIRARSVTLEDSAGHSLTVAATAPPGALPAVQGASGPAGVASLGVSIKGG